MTQPLTLFAAGLPAAACAASVTAPVASASTATTCAPKEAVEERLAHSRSAFERAKSKFIGSEQSLSAITAAEPGGARDVQALRPAELDAAKAERAFHVVRQQNGRLEALRR